MTELKNCPFCGGPGYANEHFWHVVTCRKCAADGPASDSEDQAIAAWNQRAPIADGLLERKPVAYFIETSPGTWEQVAVQHSNDPDVTPLYPDPQSQRAPVDRVAIARALCVAAYANIKGVDIDAQMCDDHWATLADAIMQLLTASAAYREGRLAGVEESAKVAEQRCATCKQWGDDFDNHCPDQFHWQTTVEAIRELGGG